MDIFGCTTIVVYDRISATTYRYYRLDCNNKLLNLVPNGRILSACRLDDCMA